MYIGLWLWHRLERAVAPWGELGSDILLELPLLDEPPAAEPGIPVVLRQAREADIDTILPFYSSDPWLYLGVVTPTSDGHEQARELYLDRMRRGELCFLAMCGDAIAHVNWTCFDWGEVLPDYPLRLRQGEVFTTDAVTPVPFRGRNLHAFVLREMLLHARARGCRHAYTLSRIDRADSMKGLFRLGWKECGRMFYFLPKGGSRTWFFWRQGNLDPLFRRA